MNGWRHNSPPGRRLNGEPGVQRHRPGGHGSKVPPELPRLSSESLQLSDSRVYTDQDTADHGDLQRGRDNVKDDRREDERDAPVR